VAVVTVDAVWVDGWGEIALGVVVARAGEGTIREVVGHPGIVAKIFHPDLKDLAQKRDKLAAMVQSRPSRAVQADGFVVLTWPMKVIDGPGGVVGYIMARIDTADAVEIHMVSNPSHRTNPAPSGPQWTAHATWQHLLTVAANLCLAVQAVHQTRAVIGDFQERNILVSDTARVTLVDCDSMQFTDTGGRQYLCGVGRPEFSAPELAGVDLRVQPREQSSDLFALAVHIHLLLMGGNHPFLRGRWTGGGEQPGAMTLAQRGDWAGGPGSALRTHPLAPSLQFMPDRILRLFARAFTEGARDPTARPSADEWRRALLAVRVTQCPRGHQIPVGARGCPWCDIDVERARRRAQREAAADLPAQQITRIGPPQSTPRQAAHLAPRSTDFSTAVGALSATGSQPIAPPRPSFSPVQRAVMLAAGVLGGLAVVIAILIVSNARDSNDREPPPTVTNTITVTTPPRSNGWGPAN
jgi:DNA-binding helix-hairpin-helix protein with protein kinase domain